jgi:hypothetical protein
MVKTIKTIGATQLPLMLACLLSMTLFIPMAQASILGVGGTAPPSPLFPTGTLLASTSGTITAPTFSDTYKTWVLADPSNTFCVGCLDFVYVFTNNGPDVNDRYSMSDFSGFQVDAGTDPFGVHDPITVDRSAGGGGVIGFNFDEFGDEIKPHETTVWLVIETDARHFTSGFLSAQDGTAGSGVGFEPTAVPEPSSLALLGGGLAVVGSLLRKSGFGKPQ